MRLWSAGFIVVCLTLPLRAEAPKFEVASVRLNDGSLPMVVELQLRHGTLRGVNVSLRESVASAFGLTGSRVIGPGWLDENRFDLAAKSPQGVPDREMKPMLQTLLKDRFLLKEHKELRALSVYDLVIAKGGVKMSVYPAPERSSRSYPSHFPMMRGTLTMSKLADMISEAVGRPVCDKTGLTETYNFVLSFASSSPRPAGNAEEFGPPDLFIALQEQLGLKLRPNKGKIEVVVIDHMERMPSEN